MGASAAPAQLQRQGPANAWKKLYKCLKAEEDGRSAAASQAEGGVRDDSWGGVTRPQRSSILSPTRRPLAGPLFGSGSVETDGCQLYRIKTSLSPKLHIYAALTSA